MKNILLPILLLALVTFGVLRAGACVEEMQPPAPPPEVAISIDAVPLLRAYRSNEVGADLKYKDKLLKVTGKIVDVKKDILDTIYITLGTGALFDRKVQAFFSDADAAKVANLKKGQKVTIVGRCRGLMINVLLKDSVLAN